jgi:hypothetical protein
LALKRDELTRIALDREGLERLKQIFNLRTDELRCGPEWVTILAKIAFVFFDCDLFFVGDCERATF